MVRIADNRESLTSLQLFLDHYPPRSFDAFVRDAPSGGRYSLERDDGYSIVNTATLLRFSARYPNFITQDKLDRAAAESELRKHLDQSKSILAKNQDRPDLAEYAAYHIAQTLSAINDDDSMSALLSWLEIAVHHSLAPTRCYEPSVFVIYLVAGQLNEEALSDGLFPSLVELLLSRQLVLAQEANGHFDAIDVALLLSLSDRYHLDSSQLNAAIDSLNSVAASNQIWTNRRPISRIGSKTIGCSAIDACIALLQRVSENVYVRLHGALTSHFEWLSYQNVSDKIWVRSDLVRNQNLHETWFNCRTYEFLQIFLSRTQADLRADLLRRYRAHAVISDFEWCDMIMEENDRVALDEGLIQPASKLRNSPAPLKKCTAILFGPPGTTKTTIAETIAKELSWPFIELGVADFLCSGFDRVFERATEIFTDLLDLSQTVVLLDEVENVFADREQKVELLQKLLTAALLPPLQRLHKQGSIILLIATNHIDSFDAAVSRPGRIDYIIPVGPPDKCQRAMLFDKMGLATETASLLAGILRDGTTLHECLMISGMNVAATNEKGAEEASKYIDAWKAEGRNAVISDDDLKRFNDSAKKHRRIN